MKDRLKETIDKTLKEMHKAKQNKDMLKYEKLVLKKYFAETLEALFNIMDQTVDHVVRAKGYRGIPPKFSAAMAAAYAGTIDFAINQMVETLIEDESMKEGARRELYTIQKMILQNWLMEGGPGIPAQEEDLSLH